MKVYITKFALTKGIVVAEGERDGKEAFIVRGAVPWDVHKFKLGEWHESRRCAEARRPDAQKRKSRRVCGRELV
jgi:hypothetical protein